MTTLSMLSGELSFYGSAPQLRPSRKLLARDVVCCILTLSCCKHPPKSIWIGLPWQAGCCRGRSRRVPSRRRSSRTNGTCPSEAGPQDACCPRNAGATAPVTAARASMSSPPCTYRQVSGGSRSTHSPSARHLREAAAHIEADSIPELPPALPCQVMCMLQAPCTYSGRSSALCVGRKHDFLEQQDLASCRG